MWLARASGLACSWAGIWQTMNSAASKKNLMREFTLVLRTSSIRARGKGVKCSALRVQHCYIGCYPMHNPAVANLSTPPRATPARGGKRSASSPLVVVFMLLCFAAALTTLSGCGAAGDKGEYAYVA